MKLEGTPADIITRVEKVAPGVRDALDKARRLVPRGNKDVYEYQAAALYWLTQRFTSPGDVVLEIGTYYGYTAAIIALARPEAQIITLNVLPWEVEASTKNLAPLKNVTCLLQNSREYISVYAGKPFKMVFVDGDHNRVKADFAWFYKLTTGGLMLFHDYAPAETPRSCVPVYNAVNEFLVELGKTEPDILVVDDSGVGMAGIVR